MSGTPVSAERLAEMLAGLEGVTPGPWVAASNHSIQRAGDMYASDGYVEALDGYCIEAPQFDNHVTNRASIAFPEDAAHIARCDPDTIRAMILELQALRASTPVEGAKPVAWLGTPDHVAVAHRLEAEASKIVKGGPIWGEGETVSIMREAAALLRRSGLSRAALDQSPTKGAE